MERPPVIACLADFTVAAACLRECLLFVHFNPGVNDLFPRTDPAPGMTPQTSPPSIRRLSSVRRPPGRSILSVPAWHASPVLRCLRRGEPGCLPAAPGPSFRRLSEQAVTPLLPRRRPSSPSASSPRPEMDMATMIPRSVAEIGRWTNTRMFPWARFRAWVRRFLLHLGPIRSASASAPRGRSPSS